MILSILVSLGPGCQKPLRLPYIPPELHNWPTPYKGTEGLKLHVFTTGSFEVPEAFLTRGGNWFKRHKLDILTFLIDHPREGLIGFNTGLSRQIAEDPQYYLGALLMALTKPKMAQGQDLLSQMQQVGFPREKVRFLIVSDLRFYHTGELEGFSSAEVVVQQKEYDAARQTQSWLYRKSHYDHVRHWKFITYPLDRPIGTFFSHYDLLGDGSLILIEASGATPGNQALLVRLPNQPALLCGSLVPIEANYRYAAVPLLLSDREAWWEKIWRLKKLKELAPELLILPDHSLKAVQNLKTPDIKVHPFRAQDSEKDAK